MKNSCECVSTWIWRRTINRNRPFCRYGGHFDFYCFRRHYGMLRGQINMYLPPGHPIIDIRNNRNQNGRRIGKKVYIFQGKLFSCIPFHSIPKSSTSIEIIMIIIIIIIIIIEWETQVIFALIWTIPEIRELTKRGRRRLRFFIRGLHFKIRVRVIHITTKLFHVSR